MQRPRGRSSFGASEGPYGVDSSREEFIKCGEQGPEAHRVETADRTSYTSAGKRIG